MLALARRPPERPLVKRATVLHTVINCLLELHAMRDSMKSRVDSLSPRQREIVRLTSLGCTSHEIATILGMSRWTVENHQFQAKERLGVSKAAVLTRVAIKHKISPLDDKLSTAEEKKLAGKAKAKAKPARKSGTRKLARKKAR
jgi:DNA-binding CsgD family transcriptional regulator